MVIEDLINTSMSNAPGWGKGFLSISLIRVQLKIMYGTVVLSTYVVQSS